MTSTKRLVLWDIDGTLMNAGPIGSRAVNEAVAAILGEKPSLQFDMGGMTDPQILRRCLASLDIEGSRADEHVDAILEHLVKAFANAEDEIRARGWVHPGVEEILSRLAESGTTTQTVLTGNVAPNAAVKLRAFGLEHWLDLEIGAFGSDDEDRNRLVPRALERAATLRGLRFDVPEIWVVGDSAADLRCARAAGVRCMLVETGRASHAELEALQPDALRADLSDVGAVIEILRS